MTLFLLSFSFVVLALAIFVAVIVGFIVRNGFFDWIPFINFSSNSSSNPSVLNEIGSVAGDIAEGIFEGAGAAIDL